MVNQPSSQRPRVRGTVLLSLLLCAGLFYYGIRDYNYLGTFRRELVPAGYWVNTYASLGLGILLLINTYLIATYRRIGLKIGLVLYILIAIQTIIAVINGTTLNCFSLFTFVLVLAVVYYLYRYLTHEPEKSFFT